MSDDKKGGRVFLGDSLSTKAHTGTLKSNVPSNGDVLIKTMTTTHHVGVLQSTTSQSSGSGNGGNAGGSNGGSGSAKAGK